MFSFNWRILFLFGIPVLSPTRWKILVVWWISEGVHDIDVTVNKAKFTQATTVSVTIEIAQYNQRNKIVILNFVNGGIAPFNGEKLSLITYIET